MDFIVLTTSAMTQKLQMAFLVEMGKNPHLLGSVLFGFYEYQGSVRVLVNFLNRGF